MNLINKEKKMRMTKFFCFTVMLAIILLPGWTEDGRIGDFECRETEFFVSELKNLEHGLVGLPVCEVIEEKGDITATELQKLLETDERFVLSWYFPMVDEESSYAKVLVNGKPAGEVVFMSSADGLLAGGNFMYSVRLLDGEKIRHFWLRYNISREKLDEVLGEMPEYFEKRDGAWPWRWKTRESRAELYRAMSSKAENLPEKMIEFQNTWEKALGDFVEKVFPAAVGKL